ncbi:hypothetical protein HDV62DRAFT_197363 [Trichoderma sp. SZMC 28011]
MTISCCFFFCIFLGRCGRALVASTLQFSLSSSKLLILFFSLFPHVRFRASSTLLHSFSHQARHRKLEHNGLDRHWLPTSVPIKICVPGLRVSRFTQLGLRHDTRTRLAPLIQPSCASQASPRQGFL